MTASQPDLKHPAPLSTWALRGTSIGAMLALVENLLALYSGRGIPLGYVLLVIVLYASVGSIVGVVIGLVARHVNPSWEALNPSAVLFTCGVTYAWSIDKTIEAAAFRDFPASVALVLSLMAVAIGAWIALRTNREPLRSTEAEVSLVFTAFAVTGWLVGGRFVAKELAGALLSARGLVVFAVGSACVIAIIVVQDRVLARLGRETTVSAKRVAAFSLALAGVMTSLVWALESRDRGIPYLSQVSASADSDPTRPSVIVVSLDTLRADRLGAYGYERPTSPNLDAFAREADVHQNVISPASWTLPSHASMFTGVLPRRHGAHFVGDPVGDSEELFSARALHDQNLTLAEILSAAGYETAGFVSNLGALTVGLGVHQGFHVYDDRPRRIWGFKPTMDSLVASSPRLRECLAKSYRPAQELNDVAFGWLRSRDDPARPLFLFLNYMDPHEPLCPPSPFDRGLPARETSDPAHDVFSGEGLSPIDQEHFRALYDNEIAYLDAHIGALFRSLRELGLYDDALVIVVSDHGEYFGEHGLWGHSYGPYDPVYRVPLLVKYPSTEERRPRVEPDYVQSLDIFATVLETVGVPIPDGVDSRSLRSRIRGERPIVIEQYSNMHFARAIGPRFGRAFTGLYEFPWKYVAFSDGETHLYNLETDPEETRNVVDEHAAVRAHFEETLSAWRARHDAFDAGAPTAIADPELLERLRTLGYVN